MKIEFIYHLDKEMKDVEEGLPKVKTSYFDDIDEAQKQWDEDCEKHYYEKSPYRIAIVEFHDEWGDGEVEIESPYFDHLFDPSVFPDVVEAGQKAIEFDLGKVSLSGFLYERELEKEAKKKKEWEKKLEAGKPALLAAMELKGYVCEKCGEWLNVEDEIGRELIEQHDFWNGRVRVDYICHSCQHKGFVEQNVRVK